MPRSTGDIPDLDLPPMPQITDVWAPDEEGMEAAQEDADRINRGEAPLYPDEGEEAPRKRAVHVHIHKD
jgi:hypothetical protein